MKKDQQRRRMDNIYHVEQKLFFIINFVYIIRINFKNIKIV